MELRTKKIFLILAFLGSIILFGFLLYYVFFRPTPAPIANVNEAIEPGVFPTPGLNVNIPTANINVNEALPTANINIPRPIVPTPTALGGITKVERMTDTPTKDATLSNNGKDIAYYDQSDGYFYKINELGQIKKLSDKKFYNVEKTYWSKDINKAIIEYPDASKVMYDFKTKKQYTIPSHWEEFDFSPDSEQITTKSIGIDPETRWLAISNADGSQARRIQALGNNGDKVVPSWSPTDQIVATYVEGIGLNRQKVYFIGKNDENFKAATIEGRGFESTWSPTGSHLLYSVYSSDSGYRPTLWITEAAGENIGSGRRPLELNTWASKCNFSSTTKIYCAVPQELEEGSGIIPEIADNTPDLIYEINLSTGSKKLIAIPKIPTTIKNVMASADGKYLYYTNMQDGKIYKINLK